MKYRDSNGQFCSRDAWLRERRVKRALHEELRREAHPWRSWIQDRSMFLAAIAAVLFLATASVNLGVLLAVWGF